MLKTTVEDSLKVMGDDFDRDTLGQSNIHYQQNNFDNLSGVQLRKPNIYIYFNWTPRSRWVQWFPQ